MKTGKGLLGTMLAMVTALSASAAQVFVQPQYPSGGQFKSSWYAPDGLDSDEYTWDNFSLGASTAITQVNWRGAYTNYVSGAGKAPVYDFSISIYRSIAGNSQPDMGPGGRLVQYIVGGNAGETPAGNVGGYDMFDYSFTLPAPFQATAGTVYWVQIEAYQGLTPNYYWPPDWSMARGTGGNNSHFRRITGGNFATITGDLAFSLYSADAPTVAINATVSPVNAGTISGAGAYPVNSTVNLIAAPNTGWGFVNWTQNGSQVSTNSHYTFTATVDRTLVANFVPAYTITTFSMPSYGGTVVGGGIYNQGSTVTLTAQPKHGFVFSGWSDGSMDQVHSFPAANDLYITAFFSSAPGCATFDFDTAPIYTSLPLDLTANGLTAHFSGTGSGFSVQQVGTVGIAPPGFSGNMLYPNSIFAADLVIDFAEPLVDFSILYSPHELGCDDSAIMRATGYMNGAFVATNTTTCGVPGTFPSETLSLASAAPFNRVVVHYDSHPVRCQDYGVIFWADNITVTRAPITCAADFNHDNIVDFFDYLDFVDAFSSMLPVADFNHDGVIDFFDYLDFVDAFSIGC